VADSPLDIAFTQSLRGPTEQRARLDNLRTRAATLISAAAIVTSFLGAEALKDTRTGAGGQPEADRTLELWELLAIAAFVGVGVLCLVILAPKTKGWLFRISGRRLLEDYIDAENPPDLPLFQRQLIGHIEDAHDANEEKLRPLIVCFQIGAILLALEVLFWLMDLTT
jgi:hypothetical protein